MRSFIASYYNFVSNVNNGLSIYNTKTGNIVFFKNDEKDDILKMLDNPCDYTGNKYFSELLNYGFIIDDNKNEIFEIAKYFKLGNSNGNSLNIVILPTESCNFKCAYCFIKEDSVKMNKQQYEDLFLYIQEKYRQFMKKNGGERVFEVNLGWFGGEPLLCIGDIIDFLKKIKEFELIEEGALRYSSKMVTNGYLLEKHTFLRLLELGNRNFQITLDGDYTNHDKWRILKNGDGTFEKIYKNLKDIKEISKNENFYVSLRGNFNKFNLEDMDRLIEKYLSDFQDDNRFDLSFRPILDFEELSKEIIDKTQFCSKQEALEIQESLAMKISGDIMDTGNRMFDALPKPINKWCNVSRENSIIVDPRGMIFACDSVVSDKSEFVGVLKSGGNVEYNSNIEKWRKTIFDSDEYSECQKCRSLPVCLGGCKRERLLGKETCLWTEEYIQNTLDRYTSQISV